MDSPPLLAPLGAAAPLQAVRGYHIEMPGHVALLNAPVVYTDEHVLVTPMNGRLRASSYMEFSTPRAPADPRKTARLRRKVAALGYGCAPEGPSWVGSRPVLPDYLPGIGRAGSAPVFYAIGHQHLGLTMAPITADLIADLVAQRPPRLPIAAFDLQRFGSPI
jgi:D-amino-acid dehydrogenase